MANKPAHYYAFMLLTLLLTANTLFAAKTPFSTLAGATHEALATTDFASVDFDTGNDNAQPPLPCCGKRAKEKEYSQHLVALVTALALNNNINESASVISRCCFFGRNGNLYTLLQEDLTSIMQNLLAGQADTAVTTFLILFQIDANCSYGHRVRAVMEHTLARGLRAIRANHTEPANEDDEDEATQLIELMQRAGRYLYVGDDFFPQLLKICLPTLVLATESEDDIEN